VSHVDIVKYQYREYRYGAIEVWYRLVLWFLCRYWYK